MSPPIDPADPCLGVNGHGFQYLEFSCISPRLGRSYLEWVDQLFGHCVKMSFFVDLEMLALEMLAEFPCLCLSSWMGLHCTYQLGKLLVQDILCAFSQVFLPYAFWNSDVTILYILNNRFEKYYDPSPVLEWMQGHNMVPVAACVAYVVFIFGGQSFFKTRPAWNWRNALAAWNLLLSVFSWIGMSRTLPQLVHNLSTMSLQENLCSNPQVTYGSGSTGLWVQLFILSKFP